MNAFLVAGFSYIAAALLVMHHVPLGCVAAVLSALLFVTVFAVSLVTGWKKAESKLVHTGKCLLLAFVLAWMMLNYPRLVAMSS